MQARAALAAFDDGVSAARRTGRALAGTLRLGYTPGAALELTPAILAEFQERHPDVSVEMREFPTGDPSAGLASGVTDVAFVRLPQGTPKIDAEALFTDPVVAMVATSHPLAPRDSVSAADLVDEPITLADSDDEVYSAFWRLDDARTDGRTPKVVTVTSVTEEANVVAAGAAIAITSAAVMRYTPLPGVRFLPIDDWPGSTLAIAWHHGERSPAVAQFVDIACTVRDRETTTVERIERWLDRRS